MRADAIELAYDAEVQEYVAASDEMIRRTGRSPITAEAASVVVSKFGETSDVAGLMLFTANGLCCYTYNNRSPLQTYLTDEVRTELLDRVAHGHAGLWHYAEPHMYVIRDASGLPKTSAEKATVICYSLKMKRRVGSEQVGTLMMSARTDVLQQIFAKCEVEDMTTVMLLDENGHPVLCSSDMEEAEKNAGWVYEQIRQNERS